MVTPATEVVFTAPPSREHLAAEEFVALARQFAVRSSDRTPSWAWIDAIRDPASPFAAPPIGGYLRASPILVPASTSPTGAHVAHALEEAQYGVVHTEDGAVDDDHQDMVRPSRLDLHIVHSASYGVPVLLLHGQHPDGTPWTPTAIREYLASRHALALPASDGSSIHSDEAHSRTPLSGAVVTQLEHPVLRTPCCCLDPCETATLMAVLLSAHGSRADGHAPATAQLDYLSAWWSVVAPLVGCASRSLWGLRDANPPPAAPKPAAG